MGRLEGSIMAMIRASQEARNSARAWRNGGPCWRRASWCRKPARPLTAAAMATAQATPMATGRASGSLPREATSPLARLMPVSALELERSRPHPGAVAVEDEAGEANPGTGRLAGGDVGQRVVGVGDLDLGGTVEAAEHLTGPFGDVAGQHADVPVGLLVVDGRHEDALHVADQGGETGGVAARFPREHAGEGVTLGLAGVLVEDQGGGEVAVGPHPREGGRKDGLGPGQVDTVALAFLDVEAEDPRAGTGRRFLAESARARRIAAAQLGTATTQTVGHGVPPIVSAPKGAVGLAGQDRPPDPEGGLA